MLLSQDTYLESYVKSPWYVQVVKLSFWIIITHQDDSRKVQRCRKDLTVRTLGANAANTYTSAGLGVMGKLDLHGYNKIGKLEYKMV